MTPLSVILHILQPTLILNFLVCVLQMVVYGIQIAPVFTLTDSLMKVLSQPGHGKSKSTALRLNWPPFLDTEMYPTYRIISVSLLSLLTHYFLDSSGLPLLTVCPQECCDLIGDSRRIICGIIHHVCMTSLRFELQLLARLWTLCKQKPHDGQSVTICAPYTWQSNKLPLNCLLRVKSQLQGRVFLLLSQSNES